VLNYYYFIVVTLKPVPDAYFRSPVEFRTLTESESVIGHALCNVLYILYTFYMCFRLRSDNKVDVITDEFIV